MSLFGSLGNLKKGFATLKLRLLIIGIIGFLLLLLFTAVFLYQIFFGVVCRGLVGDALAVCPQPLVKEKDLLDLSVDVHLKRNNIVSKKFPMAERFRGEFADIDDEGRLNYKAESLLYILILEQLDTEMWLMYKDSKKALQKDGIGEGSNYFNTLDRAIKDTESLGWFKSIVGKVFFIRDVSHNFMKHRLKVWECFLIGKDGLGSCESDLTKNGDTDILRTSSDKVFYDKNGDPVTRHTIDTPKLTSIFDKYFPHSLYYDLENGKELYEQRIEELLIELNFFSKFPDQNAGRFIGATYEWIAPMETGTYYKSSSFGPRMLNGAPDYHRGVDFSTSGGFGVPIYAAKAGVVIGKGVSDSYGSLVTIDHQDGYYSSYAHMKYDDIVVDVGQVVEQGQLIAAVASEGLSDGAHLHFEICDSVATDVRDGIQYASCEKRLNPEIEPFNLKVESRLDKTLINRRINEFYSDLKQRAKNGDKIIMPGMRQLGFISAKYESRGDPGICVNNKGDSGGLSCGLYQIATNTGTMNEFLNVLKKHYPEIHEVFKGISPKRNEPEFRMAWTDAYNRFDQMFVEAQHIFIKVTHYDPVVAGILSHGGFPTNMLSPAIQELVWSFAVHRRHAVYQYTKDFGESNLSLARLDNGGWQGLSEEDIIKRMFIGRREQNPQQMYVPRFKDEENDILEYLRELKGE